MFTELLRLYLSFISCFIVVSILCNILCVFTVYSVFTINTLRILCFLFLYLIWATDNLAGQKIAFHTFTFISTFLCIILCKCCSKTCAIEEMWQVGLTGRPVCIHSFTWVLPATNMHVWQSLNEFNWLQKSQKLSLLSYVWKLC